MNSDEKAGPKWVKHWQAYFMRGIYRAIHERDVEEARKNEKS